LMRLSGRFGIEDIAGWKGLMIPRETLFMMAPCIVCLRLYGILNAATRVLKMWQVNALSYNLRACISYCQLGDYDYTMQRVLRLALDS
jgi:hypothetical protein